MVKETPSLGRILAMVVFTMSCVGILLFLWLAFGGSIPLRPEAYRMQVSFPEAATLSAEADVRLAGVNVGKVKTKELEKAARADAGGAGAQGAVRARARGHAGDPAPEDAARRDLRGALDRRREGPPLKDGGRLADVYVEPTVELDEIFNAFDKPTRTAFQEWVSELSKAIEGGRGQDLNDAFGNIEGFAVDGATLLEELERAGDGGPAAGAQHGPRVRRDQPARGRPAPADRELQQHVRSHGLARRGAGRHLPGVPNLPRRVEGHACRGCRPSPPIPGRW